MRASEPRYRSSVLDRALTPSRTVAAVGPVRDLEVTRAAAVLAAAARHPAPHLALDPRADETRWHYRTDIDRQVTRRDDIPTADIGALLTSIRRETPRRPLGATLCGDYVTVDYSHGIGDGQLGTSLLAALSGDVGEQRCRTLALGLPEHAVRSAAWRHFRRHPRAVRDVAALRARHKADGAGQRPTKEIAGWQEHNLTLTGYMPPEAVGALRAWAKASTPGATTASVTVAHWMAALRDVGADVDDHVQILMNCRRYLDARHHPAQGNFAVAMPMLLPPSGSPAEIAALTRRVFDSGWPLTVLLAAEVKALLGRGGAVGDATAPGRYDAAGRIRVSVSDLGRLTMFEHASWVPGGPPPQLAAYLEPDGPDAVTLLVSELAGGRTFTATFCAAVVDPDLVGRALHRMCTDPLATLPAH